MTECERLINAGAFSVDFLRTETICGHFVDENTKKTWMVELDLLREFDRICKKYDLRYFAFGGTILGAVRHHGFIPWDDDIDVAMPMADYLRIQAIAQEEIRHPYVLQTPYLDPGSFFSFMKLRNSETTFTSKVFHAQSFNQGAFIDIFPLVECPPDKIQEQRAQIYPSIMRCSNYMKRGGEDVLNARQLERMKTFYTEDPMSEHEKIYKELNNPKYKDCGWYTHASLFLNYDEYHIWESALWKDTIEWPFAITTVPLPNGWEQIMTEYYGNYMEFPPVEQRVSLHADMIIDMDTPYKNYIWP